MKSFRDFKKIDREDIQEASLLGKGFALGQQSRATAVKQRIEGIDNQIQSTINSARSADDLSKKIDYLLQTISLLSKSIRAENEFSTHIMNVAVADALLSDDLNTVIQKQFEKNRK